MSDPLDYPTADEILSQRLEAVRHTSAAPVNLRTADDDAVATTTYTPGSHAKNARLARRLVLCWNACLGVPDDELRELDEVTD